MRPHERGARRSSHLAPRKPWRPRSQNVTEIPSEKFEVPPTSRYHSWKFQVAPETITPPGGVGSTASTSKPEPTVLVPARFWKTPAASNLPIEFRPGPAVVV